MPRYSVSRTASAVAEALAHLVDHGHLLRSRVVHRTSSLSCLGPAPDGAGGGTEVPVGVAAPVPRRAREGVPERRQGVRRLRVRTPRGAEVRLVRWAGAVDGQSGPVTPRGAPDVFGERIFGCGARPEPGESPSRVAARRRALQGPGSGGGDLVDARASRCGSSWMPGPMVEASDDLAEVAALGRRRLGPLELVEHGPEVGDQGGRLEADLADRARARCRGGRCGTRPCRP